MSGITIVCDNCGAKYKLAATFQGDRANCQKCGSVIAVGKQRVARDDGDEPAVAAAAKPAATRPASERPATPRPVITRQADRKPADRKPADRKPTDRKPAGRDADGDGAGSRGTGRRDRERPAAGSGSPKLVLAVVGLIVVAAIVALVAST